MSGVRLLITVEGQTEERFVKRVLAPYLCVQGIYPEVRAVLTSRDRRASKEYRGGLLRYERARNDMVAWIRSDPRGRLLVHDHVRSLCTV